MQVHGGIGYSRHKPFEHITAITVASDHRRIEIQRVRLPGICLAMGPNKRSTRHSSIETTLRLCALISLIYEPDSGDERTAAFETIAS